MLYEQLALKVGCPSHIFMLLFNVYGALATSCWLKDLWHFLWEQKIQLTFPIPSFYQQQDHDNFLIFLFHSMGASTSDLVCLNHYQLCLHVLTRSDVTAGDCLSLCDSALCTNNTGLPFNSKFHIWLHKFSQCLIETYGNSTSIVVLLDIRY
eukprot:11682447-Ditylum_brightwellii.AAC.1